MVLLLGYIVTAGIYHSNNEKRCTAFDVVFLDSTLGFITPDQIVSIIDSAGVNPINTLRSQIRLHEIEKIIKNNVYVDSVEVFSEVNGNCVVRIKQREPSLHITSTSGHNFYLTKDLHILPPTSNYLHKVRIVNGSFNFPFSSEFFGEIEKKDDSIGINLKKLLNFVSIVENDPFANDFIVQIWVDSAWRVDLVPNIGDQLIVLGALTDCGEKLHKMGMFYRKTFKDGWWGVNKEVVLEYKNQIIIR